MTELQALAHRINTLIGRRDAGENTQTEIDALMIQFEAHPAAEAIRQASEAETRAAYAGL